MLLWIPPSLSNLHFSSNKHNLKKRRGGNILGAISPLDFNTKKNNKVLIRTAEESDGPGMYHLTKEVILEENGLIMTIHDFTMSIQDQINRNHIYLQHPQTIAIIALLENNLLGILSIEPEHLIKTCHRGNLGIIIHRNYRSEGLGKKLMETAIQWAKENRVYEKLELEVLQSNEQAILLYEKLGFTREGVIEKAVKHQNNRYDNLLKMGLYLQ